MTLIDTGDLTLSGENATLQQRLFNAIRAKIVEKYWPVSAKLPSTRKLAMELNLSRNTVITTYEQLVAEGYIESKQGSGFYVALELPDAFVQARVNPPQVEIAPALDLNNSPFAPGVPDLNQFPMKHWQRMLQRHLSRSVLMGNQPIQGSMPLRQALSDYLSSSRSVSCCPQRIIITSGAQQAMTLALLATLKADDRILMEYPGYTQVMKIIELFRFQFEPLPVHQGSGIHLTDVNQSQAKALYLTPSNQYPMGTTITTEHRLKLIEWAAAQQSWIIEDDYDSEFQFAHRPYTSLQGLAGQIGLDHHVIYVGSLSKVMFNSLRLGYMVVPEHLMGRCLEIKEAISGDPPAHTQAALADFIAEGHLIRHVRKMRRVYKRKYHILCQAVEQAFGDRLTIISQAAGLHVTLKWQGGIREQDWVDRAIAEGIVMRPLGYYQHKHPEPRSWQAVVLGFGHVAEQQIESRIEVLARLFES
ncbi:PLP-dependent aminotransferase family protein [Vibrio ostreicida]|uniref:PLP-dependent aminotransferase family protein n=1 Tax=Vibrio ostreicida TaxID=526588 RepID=A0ABT8C0T2_9VIBR|nr:PLP-dependent aminotransferase family protein [Vibrio ostreicida]MDN3612549.1 PLP-dependent aminotransferase family protein [Vibrio ostreicida]NPD09170.1 PLP-dependent aminotransferase family protein [Vibrio ostreicida]